MRLNKIDSKDVQALSAYLESREAGVDQQMNAKVLDIIEQVRTRKDDALLEYTEKFDHVKLDSLIMSEEEIEAVMSKVDASLIADLKDMRSRKKTAFTWDSASSRWSVSASMCQADAPLIPALCS